MKRLVKKFLCLIFFCLAAISSFGQARPGLYAWTVKLVVVDDVGNSVARGARASRSQSSASRRRHLKHTATHRMDVCLRVPSSRRDADLCDRDGRAPRAVDETGQP